MSILLDFTDAKFDALTGRDILNAKRQNKTDTAIMTGLCSRKQAKCSRSADSGHKQGRLIKNA